MAQSSSITKSDIRALANTQSFERGKEYYKNNLVYDLVRRGKDFTAKVEGNGYEPYRVQVTIDDDSIIATSCTCPYDWGGICKHIVATLLAVIHESGDIVEKPELHTLLTDLTADQLRQILTGLTERGPEFSEAVEQEISWLKDQPIISSASPSTTVTVDINAVRREINKDFRLAGKGDPFQHGYYDEYSGMEMDPDVILQPHLEKVLALLDEGDVETAETLITLIINAYIDGMSELDEWVYEYNQDVLSEANLTLGAVLAEVLLTLDLEPGKQNKWLDQIADWEGDLGDLDIAVTAVEQGWTYPPLVAAMKGNITEKGAWEEEAPYYADELTLARLHVLARQELTQEYIHLAEAEGQIELAINKRVENGDVEQAVADAKAYIRNPQAILYLAEVLVDKGEVEASFEVAVSGLKLEEKWGYGKVELARWTREKAAAAGKNELALEAAQAAFTSSYALDDYKAVQRLAGDQWQTIKPELLKELEQGYSPTMKIDVYLFEDMLAEAMAVLDNPVYAPDHDLRRVIEVTREKHPHWGIRVSKEKAEAIMDAGSSGSYETAVSWLKITREIYLQHKMQQEWKTYLDSLLETHHRKYKLVPMLRDIRR
ncbi:MAG: SWIM zinc finger family protein [Candidatus Promineifilaceae bacterium]